MGVKNNTKGFTSVVIIVIIGVIAITVIGVAWWYESSRKEPANINKTVTTNKNVNTNIAISDWQTYKNTTYNYSIQYPTDYEINNIKDNGKSLTIKNTIKAPDVNDDIGSSQTVYITVFTSSEDESDYNQELYAWAMNGFIEPYVTGYFNKGTAKLGSNTFISFGVVGGMIDANSYFLIKDDVVFQIQDSIVQAENHDDNKAIISTFQFLN